METNTYNPSTKCAVETNQQM